MFEKGLLRRLQKKVEPGTGLLRHLTERRLLSQQGRLRLGSLSEQVFDNCGSMALGCRRVCWFLNGVPLFVTTQIVETMYLESLQAPQEDAIIVDLSFVCVGNRSLSADQDE